MKSLLVRNIQYSNICANAHDLPMSPVDQQTPIDLSYRSAYWPVPFNTCDLDFSRLCYVLLLRQYGSRKNIWTWRACLLSRTVSSTVHQYIHDSLLLDSDAAYSHRYSLCIVPNREIFVGCVTAMKEPVLQGLVITLMVMIYPEDVYGALWRYE